MFASEFENPLFQVMMLQVNFRNMEELAKLATEQRSSEGESGSKK